MVLSSAASFRPAAMALRSHSRAWSACSVPASSHLFIERVEVGDAVHVGGVRGIGLCQLQADHSERFGRAIPPSACRNAGLSAPFHPLSLQFGRVATILTFVDRQTGKSATFGVQSTRKEVPGVTAVGCSADI